MALNATTDVPRRPRGGALDDRPAADDDGQRGSIVLMSSVTAFDPSPHWFATHAYAAAKAAVIGLMRTTRGVLRRPRHPRQCPRPGHRRHADGGPRRRRRGDGRSPASASSRWPAGMLDPDDVADAAVFLCSRESRMVTGQTLAVDAGWSVRGDER